MPMLIKRSVIKRFRVRLSEHQCNISWLLDMTKRRTNPLFINCIKCINIKCIRILLFCFNIYYLFEKKKAFKSDIKTGSLDFFNDIEMVSFSFTIINLNQYDLRRDTKLNVYKAIIRFILLYGTEYWVIYCAPYVTLNASTQMVLLEIGTNKASKVPESYDALGGTRINNERLSIFKGLVFQ